MVSINNEPSEVIQDIINLPSIFEKQPSIFEKQPAKEAEENENNKSVNERGEPLGPETRSKSKTKHPEED